MSRSERQNGPFCEVKRLILKIGMKNRTILNGFFSVSEAFALKKRSKISAKIFAQIC